MAKCEKSGQLLGGQLLGGLGLVLLLVLGGCATDDGVSSKQGDVDTIAPSVTVEGGAGSVAAQPSVNLGDYAGRSRQNLENLLGLPALTRSEGAGNFLRFDIGECRIWAATRYEEGEEIIATIKLGPSRQGDPVPDINDCLQVGV
jgi:hypothetical protein